MKSRICIVVAYYYPKISKELVFGASNVLKKNGIKNFKVIISPGIFEITVIIARNIKYYVAFVALGCVIKGKTPHFDLISKAATNGIMDLAINYKKPIGNGIISCFNKKQAYKRSSPNEKNKGGEAAKAVLSVLGILKNDTRWC